MFINLCVIQIGILSLYHWKILYYDTKNNIDAYRKKIITKYPFKKDYCIYMVHLSSILYLNECCRVKFVYQVNHPYNFVDIGKLILRIKYGLTVYFVFNFFCFLDIIATYIKYTSHPYFLLLLQVSYMQTGIFSIIS